MKTSLFTAITLCHTVESMPAAATWKYRKATQFGSSSKYPQMEIFFGALNLPLRDRSTKSKYSMRTNSVPCDDIGSPATARAVHSPKHP
jgi:hypothetical protein